MQIVTGANVYTARNEKLGHVDRVVVDPQSKKVTHLVVRKGFLLKTDKVLPIDWVAAADGDHISLTPDATGLDNLPNFEEKHYIRSDDAVAVTEAEGLSPAAHSAPAMAPMLLWYPPAMGVYPVPGVVGAPRPARVRYVKTVEANIPANTVALKEGAKVLSADGEHIGDVERLVVNGDTKEVTHLLVKEGILFKKHKAIPADWIGEAYEEEIHLVVDKKLLSGLPDFTG
jgi:uncharacterized protein YrrD